MTEIPEDNNEKMIPFKKDDWVEKKANPGDRAQYTGRNYPIGPGLVMVVLKFPDGSEKEEFLPAWQAVPQSGTSKIPDNIISGSYGGESDLRRLITHEKLKGTLHEVVYSMEAAQIDFKPYQFKPVLKFINSPSERLILADEVGLGKTIEAALIWLELEARRQARRLLVVCPKILTQKWHDELREKFQLDAKIADNVSSLEEQIRELEAHGSGHSFVMVASYDSLKPRKKDIKSLDTPPEQEVAEDRRARVLQKIRHWDRNEPPFDMVIFDEAHYMRNPSSSRFHLGINLTQHTSTAVLCVSATPVNNSNDDLRSLLRLVDQDFFETRESFDERLRENRPAVAALNAISRVPIDMPKLGKAVGEMKLSPFLRSLPWFEQFRDVVNKLEKDPSDKSMQARAQGIAEKLNLIGDYVNRTRRVQVEEARPERKPYVLTVEYTEAEMAFYRRILYFVRSEFHRNNNRFHILQIMGLQLQAASCLPVLAKDIQCGKFAGQFSQIDGSMQELLTDGLGNHVFDFYDDEELYPEIFGDFSLEDLNNHDFEGSDSKFQKLRDELLNNLNDPKIIIFAYYRKTLEYLRRRLQSHRIGVEMIHGGVNHDDRMKILDKFRNDSGVRILLSSEVGSEGIDLQFCRVVINYDLPWNPMRVEQRIGRIDRVGQKADKLAIINFKVKDTIEERLYDRLHEKLARFSSSLGDLEAVIGEQIDKLTIELISQDLSPQEQVERMEQVERVIENQAQDLQLIEDSGDSLVGLSDYVQKQISDKKARGQYIQSAEMEAYLTDFFGRTFQDSEVLENTPSEGCLRINLCHDAFDSLDKFMKDDRSLSARHFRQRNFSITFDREIHESLAYSDRNRVKFANHLSPLVRWMARLNKERLDGFHNTSALILEDDELPSATYVYRVARWKFSGVRDQEEMVTGIQCIETKQTFDPEESDRIMQKLLNRGYKWDYPDCDNDAALIVFRELESEMQKWFIDGYNDFKADNESQIRIRKERITRHFDRLIRQSESAIITLLESGRKDSMIRGRRTRLKNEHANKQRALRDLDKNAETIPGSEILAGGIFKVIRPGIIR